MPDLRNYYGDTLKFIINDVPQIEKTEDFIVIEEVQNFKISSAPIMTEIVEYPLLVYNSYMPDRSELVVTNMAEISKELKVIKLDGLSFISFVNSTFWTEEFENDHIREDHSMVFFLAWDKKINEYRIMVLSCDPWSKAKIHLHCLKTKELRL